jgi:methionyl-tRNA synthetase
MITINDFKKLDLKIAVIKDAQDHPNADKLIVLTLDVGDVTKEVVAGIKLHYKKEELIGKQVVLVDNLEPVNLRGVQSQGMILAASDNETLSLLVPERPVKCGSQVR